MLSTKFFANLHPGDPNGGGAGRKAIVVQLDQSLRRLQTDYVDLYWLHGWDRRAPVEETMQTLDDLVTAGKIRYVGVRNLPAWVTAQSQQLRYFRGWAPATALQAEYSLLERTAEGELLPMAEDLGIGILPWSPLRNGHPSGAYVRGGAGHDSALSLPVPPVVRTELAGRPAGRAGERRPVDRPRPPTAVTRASTAAGALIDPDAHSRSKSAR